MRKLLITGCCLLITCYVMSQQFGGNAPSLKWKQINTDSVRIIFPAGLDSQAKRAASIVHYLAANKPVSLGNQLKKVNVVLQNQTTLANGYVGLGPFRSEFFLTPPLTILRKAVLAGLTNWLFMNTAMCNSSIISGTG